MTTTEIATRTVNGRPAVTGPAALIEPALRGAAPITVTLGPLTGDTLWLKSITTWGNHGMIAQATVPLDVHPEHGQMVAAYIDEQRLDAAPAMRAIRVRQHAALTAQQRRINASVPACDNCGDCSRCC